MTIYRIGRRIVCYVVGNFVRIGRPSDKIIDDIICGSRDDAESVAMDFCKNVILERMKYENPVKYNAIAVLNRLA